MPILSEKPGVSGGSLRILVDTGVVVTAEMSLEEWIAVANHPRYRGGRNTGWEQATRPGAVVREAQRQVVAVEFNGGFYKINGHRRGELWDSGQLRAPGSVFVTIYRVESKQEFDDLYGTFNGRTAGAQYDKIASAMRECGLEVKSKRLRYGYILTALNIALRGKSRAHQDKANTPSIDIYKAVRAFSRELELLDGVDPQPDVFYNGVIAAALIALTLSPDAGLEFFRKLSAKEGSKRDGMMDPVEAVLAQIQAMKSQRSAWITAQQEDLCGRTLQAFTAWRKGEHGSNEYWIKNRVRPLDFEPLIRQVKELKQIASAQDL